MNKLELVSFPLWFRVEADVCRFRIFSEQTAHICVYPSAKLFRDLNSGQTLRSFCFIFPFEMGQAWEMCAEKKNQINCPWDIRLCAPTFGNTVLSHVRTGKAISDVSNYYKNWKYEFTIISSDTHRIFFYFLHLIRWWRLGVSNVIIHFSFPVRLIGWTISICLFLQNSMLIHSYSILHNYLFFLKYLLEKLQ